MATDNLQLRCSNCHGVVFEIRVRSTLDVARITSCICKSCSKVRKFDNNGNLLSLRVTGDDIIIRPPRVIN